MINHVLIKPVCTPFFYLYGFCDIQSSFLFFSVLPVSGNLYCCSLNVRVIQIRWTTTTQRYSLISFFSFVYYCVFSTNRHCIMDV